MKEDMFFLDCAILWGREVIITKWDQSRLIFSWKHTHTHTPCGSLYSHHFYLFLAENQGAAWCQQPLLQPSVHSWTHCSSCPWSRFHFCIYLIGYTRPQPVHIINLSAGSTWVTLCCPISYWTQTFSQLHSTREGHFHFTDHPWPILRFALQAYVAIHLLVNNLLVFVPLYLLWKSGHHLWCSLFSSPLYLIDELCEIRL